MPTLLDDPEFRDDAVAIVLKRGDTFDSQKNKIAAKQAYESAFQHARNADQVTAAARKLESLGEKVSIQAHLGFVTGWSLIGPFPAAGHVGFSHALSPGDRRQSRINRQTADKKASAGSTIKRPIPLAPSICVQVLGPVNEAVGYAFTEIDSPEATRPNSAAAPTTAWPSGSTAKKSSAGRCGSTAPVSTGLSRQ